MEIIIPGHRYELWQLGGGTQLLNIAVQNASGWKWKDLIWVLANRTWHLDGIKPCGESADAAEFCEMAMGGAASCPKDVRIEDAGHIYTCGRERLIFVKRSDEAVRYPREWAGVQSQEVMRALIEHLEHRRYIFGEDIRLDDGLIPEDMMRHALFSYEVRAWRRKQERVNREHAAHKEGPRAKAWRPLLYSDVPFDIEGVELLPIGEDGHIVPEAA